MEHQSRWKWTALGAAAALFIVLVYAFVNQASVWLSESTTEGLINKDLSEEHESFSHLDFNLVDPNQAPASIKDLVMLGYKIMLETEKYASGYANDHLSCTNCHFSGGITTGGERGGISLAGVAAKYPHFDKRFKKVIDLPQRINNCFLRSMNGKALPLDSHEMLALVTYLHSISHNFPIYTHVPWLGLEPLSIKYDPDKEKGAKYYTMYCALCHQENGEGSSTILLCGVIIPTTTVQD